MMEMVKKQWKRGLYTLRMITFWVWTRLIDLVVV
jgi:hypothetical protein